MSILYTLGLFIITAIAEIVGCYLPYLWLKKSASAWVLLPAAFSLALFALTKGHPLTSFSGLPEEEVAVLRSETKHFAPRPDTE